MPANTPGLSPDGRSRRYRGSSSDQDSPIDEFINEDFRVGGPELAVMPCGLRAFTKDHPAYQMWEDDRTFCEEIKQIVQKHGIEFQFIDLIRQILKDPYSRGPDRALPTTVIAAKRGNPFDSPWLSTCQELRRCLADRQLLPLNVEIIDHRGAKPRSVSGVVPEDDPIYPIWEEKVIANIRPFLGCEGWVALECFRWGPDGDGEDRPDNPTTVALTVPYGTERDWRPTREAIANVLHQLGLHHVAVVILRGDIWRGASSENCVSPDNAWKTGVQCGVSIGPANSEASSSTLGAVLELLDPESENWVPFGITSFRSVMARNEATAREEKNRKLMTSPRVLYYLPWAVSYGAC